MVGIVGINLREKTKEEVPVVFKTIFLFINKILEKMEQQKLIKQCVGIDCGKLELVCSLGVMQSDYSEKIVSTGSFKNTTEGFKKLEKWALKHADKTVSINYVLEATGVYHEKIALHLHKNGDKVSVILPNKAKAFTQTLSVKTVNDKTSSQSLAYLGLEKQLDCWQPPQPIYGELKQLTREREQLISERTQCKNQLHAEESGAWPNKSSIKRIRQRIKLLDKQMLEIEKEIEKIVDANEALKKKMKYVCSIKGIGLISAASIVAETNGFHLIRNKKQLVSYAGLDVVEKQSGISVQGRTKISRKGNKCIRKALFFPGLVAIRHTAPMKALYKRLVSKHGIKMKAAVAVQKKMLELVYVLWKKEELFQEDYLKNKGQQAETPVLCELA